MKRQIARVVTKRTRTAPKTDAEYWRSRSYEERLQALEEIRQEYHQWKGDAQSGFQRVYRIIKCK
jgi:hypothetical protein